MKNGHGTYNLSAGTVYGALEVGGGNGTVNQSGGVYSNTFADSFVVGGVYNLSGGSITNSNPQFVWGTFDQPGAVTLTFIPIMGIAQSNYLAFII